MKNPNDLFGPVETRKMMKTLVKEYEVEGISEADGNLYRVSVRAENALQAIARVQRTTPYGDSPCWAAIEETPSGETLLGLFPVVDAGVQ